MTTAPQPVALRLLEQLVTGLEATGTETVRVADLRAALEQVKREAS